jgi:hypothetical protein
MISHRLRIEETSADGTLDRYSLIPDQTLPSAVSIPGAEEASHPSANAARVLWITTNGYWVVFIRHEHGQDYASTAFFPYGEKTAVDLAGGSHVRGEFE